MTQKAEIRMALQPADKVHRVVRVAVTRKRAGRLHHARVIPQAADPIGYAAMAERQAIGYGEPMGGRQSDSSAAAPDMIEQRTKRRGSRSAARASRREMASVGSEASQSTSLFNFGGGSVVAEARRWIGTNPTRRKTLWCATFMNFVLERTGYTGTGSDLARSFASLGHRVSGPQVGAIAVMQRRGGGHVGVVSGIDADGNPIIISGNQGRRVAESVYPRSRIYAYVMP